MRLLYIFLIFFSFAIGLEVNADEADTEAGAGCTTPECLGVAGVVGSPDLEVAELCRKTLPAHCQQIKDIKFTVCYDDQAYVLSASAASGWSCLVGLASGGTDVLTRTGKIAVGTYDFAMDGEHREEVLNTMSFFFEQFSDSEKFKELLSGPLLEEMDEFMECLNYRGRWEYVCEVGIQTAVPLYGYKKIKQFVGGRRRNIEKLSIKEKFQQRRDLQKLLSGTAPVDIGKLSGYQLSRLKPKNMARMDISNFTDDIGSFLSNRQLRGIPPSKMSDLKILANHRTLGRLSNDQFKIAISNQKLFEVSKLPINVIEDNIKRIPAKEIPRFFQLDQISPKAFSRMSAPQIRNMSYRQVNDVTPEQTAKLPKRKKQTLKETREKRSGEEVERKNQAEKAKAEREQKAKREERNKRARETRERRNREEVERKAQAEKAKAEREQKAKRERRNRRARERRAEQRQQREQQQQQESGGAEGTPASGASTGGTTKPGSAGGPAE